MLEVIKKIMEAAEELGTVSKFSACDWVNPGEYRVTVEGKNGEGVAFRLEVTLMPPGTESKEQE